MTPHTSRYCPSCQSAFPLAHLRDPATCPECGGELEDDKALTPPAECDHPVKQRDGSHGDGQACYRCVRCGEVI